MNKKRIITTIIIFIIDQLIKYLIQIFNINIDIINNIFKITYVQNTGAAFSILTNHNLLLIFISLIILILIYQLSFSIKENNLNDISFGLLFGGIIGNLSDRIFLGFIRDFISILNFPVFNIADSAIVIGVILLLIGMFKEGKIDGNKSKRRRKKRKNR